MIRLAFKTPIAKSIKYLEQKSLKTTFNFYELQKEAHHKAFTVASITRMDLLADIYSSLITAQKEGLSYKEFKKDLIPVLKKKGWWGKKELINPKTGEIREVNIGSYRIRRIFETNTRVAHAVGRANNIYASANEYIRYSSILDSRTRPEHASMHGIVKHKNDKFWEKNFPPNGYGCRCYVTSLNARDLKRLNIKVNKDNLGVIADKEFAHDLRFLDKNNLENYYYNKALNYAKKCKENNAKGGIPCKASSNIVKNAIEYIYSNSKIKAYQDFCDKTTKDISHPQNKAIAGAIDYNTFVFLVSKNITPVTPHIYISKHSLTHMLREAKAKREASLDLEEIKNIPNVLKNPKEILWDTEHKNILYIQESSDNKENKVVLEINYKYKKDVLNMLVTAGKVQANNLKDEKYIKIK